MQGKFERIVGRFIIAGLITVFIAVISVDFAKFYIKERLKK